MGSRVISIFGSGEFQEWSEEVDRFALDRASAGDGSVVIIPTASAPEGEDVFLSWASLGLEHYERMEVRARVSGLKYRADAYSEDHVAVLEGASMFYFSGGNPAFLADTLRDTPFWQTIMRGVDQGVVLAGCSAGACIMGEMAPDSNRAPSEIDSLFVPGLQVMPGYTFGPHWDMLPTWAPGLQNLILGAVPEGCTLVTLDENTAIVGDGTTFQVFGSGQVGIAADGAITASHLTGETLTFRAPATG